MARKYDGASDKGTVPLDLSKYSQASISWWQWWDTGNGANDMAFEFGATTSAAGAFTHEPITAGATKFFFGIGSGAGQWSDTIPAPAFDKWNHFLWTIDRAVPVNKLWVNGISQTTTLLTHTAGTYGNFGNLTLNLMCRNNGSLFGAGRLADWAFYGGVLFGLGEASELSKRVSPLRIRPDRLTVFMPMEGAAGNRDSSFGRMGAPITPITTITGTIGVAHPFGYQVIPRNPRKAVFV